MSSNRGRDNRGEGVEVAAADEMRDGNTVRGTVTDAHTVAPSAGTGVVRQETVRHETVRRQPAPEGTREVEIPEAYNLTRDRVRWGPIWAGLLTALTSLLLLSLLGLAVGLTTVDAEEAARQGGLPVSTGRNSAIWGGLSAILAFLLGGYVAGKTAAIFNRRWGALNGALVFLTAVPLLLWLAGQGVGALLGTLGNYVSGLNIDPAQVQGAANQAQQGSQNTTPEQAATAAENVRNGAWGTLIGSLLGLGSSALGGLLGTRSKVEVDPQTNRVLQ